MAFLSMQHISKTFGTVQANRDITFEAKRGEIHALLGENGAGKSTLMNILCGMYQQDAGEIFLRGERVKIKSPQDSIQHGIGMVHQQFLLVPPFTVTENVILGLPSPKGLFLEMETAANEISALSSKYNLKVDPQAPIWQLSVGTRQRVEIIKALYRGAELLVLDEPTAVLTPGEMTEFFATLRQMADQGHTIIFITHKLEEVMAISHRCTVLRDGCVIDTVDTQDTSEIELAHMMVGREVVLQLERKPIELGETVLKVRNLSVIADNDLPAIRNLNLEVHAGEILGVAGVDGNGQTELAEALIGLRKPTEGSIYVDTKDTTNLSRKQLLEHKVTHIPEDRVMMGLVPKFSVAENLVLDSFDETPFCRRLFDKGHQGFLLCIKTIMDHAKQMITEYSIKPESPSTQTSNLSGGNLQKLMLARALYRIPRVLIAMHPTRGLDVGATEQIRNRLLTEREAGRAILLISADLDEVLELSDRIAVLFEGRIMATIAADQVDLDELGKLMAGVKRNPQ
jgi:ABC-type uncharacterized transport system ATPase subunit